VKKLFLITVLFSLFLSTDLFSQSSSIIKNKKITDVKSQLINFEINQGFQIENETNNTISFTKLNTRVLETTVLVLRYGAGEFYDRNRYNFSQLGNDVRIFYFREVFSSKSNENMSLSTTEDMKKLNQDYLDKFVNSIQ